MFMEATYENDTLKPKAKAKFYIWFMIRMVFDNLISFAKDVDFQDTSICTEWKSVKKYEDRDNYPNYDYFPHSVPNVV